MLERLRELPAEIATDYADTARGASANGWQALSLHVEAQRDGTMLLVVVKINNLTGHKLPTLP